MSPRHERLAVVGFFALYLIGGFAIYRDFGASWDELINKDLGVRTLRYVESRWSKDPIPWSTISKGLVAEQGPLFETILVVIERVLGLRDPRAILLMRHLATFLAFWLGMLAFYALLRECSESRKVALLGVSLLVLTPRLFAHSFYNSKDAVLAALFIAGALTMVRFLRERSALRAALHALACAAAVSVRLVGLLLPAMTLVLLLLHLGQRGVEKREWKQAGIVAGFYLVLLSALVVLLSPALWESPIGTFLRTLRGLATAKQRDNNLTLYFGSFVRVDQLPWHYVPAWMLLTLPLSYVLFFMAGLGAVGAKLWKGPLSSLESVRSLVFVLWFFVPLVAAIVVRPVLYDDWRHLYFLQPALVAIAVAGIAHLAARPRLKKLVAAAALLMVAHGVVILIRYHPYQNVYFSPLAGGNVEEAFELDYWGLSFRKGLEYVLDAEPEGIVRIHVSDVPGVVNSWILEASQRSRLRIGPLEEATYFLSNHRQPEHYANFRAGRYPCINEVHAVRVAGATLLAVYKIR
jgi:hypothetical protein